MQLNIVEKRNSNTDCITVMLIFHRCYQPLALQVKKIFINRVSMFNKQNVHKSTILFKFACNGSKVKH